MDENIRLIPGSRDFEKSRPILSRNEITLVLIPPHPAKKKKYMCEAKPINDGIFLCTSPFLLGSEF